jgi:hypothetical protein
LAETRNPAQRAPVFGSRPSSPAAAEFLQRAVGELVVVDLPSKKFLGQAFAFETPMGYIQFAGKRRVCRGRRKRRQPE